MSSDLDLRRGRVSYFSVRVIVIVIIIVIVIVIVIVIMISAMFIF
jgi:hypothetical protein